MDAPTLSEVAEGVFAWVQPDGTWWINNAGAVSGAGGTVVVDTCATAARTRAFLDALRRATEAPVRMAVNTHQHGDHTYGNSLLPTETVLVGHENMRAGLAVDRIIDGCPPLWSPVPDWGPVTKRLPDLAVSAGATLWAGDRPVEVRHPGYAAHTTGDLVAWVPDVRVLFAGDLVFHGLTPLVFMGSVRGALRSLDWLAAYEPDLLVPGHGPLVTAADLSRVLGEHERYYRLVLDLADTGRREGLTPLEAARTAELGAFAAWADAERLVLNLHRAYAEAQDVEPDLMQAFADAVTWNGGPMTTHVCA